jgi:hypothetical protein
VRLHETAGDRQPKSEPLRQRLALVDAVERIEQVGHGGRCDPRTLIGYLNANLTI